MTPAVFQILTEEDPGALDWRCFSSVTGRNIVVVLFEADLNDVFQFPRCSCFRSAV